MTLYHRYYCPRLFIYTACLLAVRCRRTSFALDKPVNKVIQITVSYFFRHKIDFIIRPKKDLRCPLDPVIIQIFLERYTIFFRNICPK